MKIHCKIQCKLQIYPAKHSMIGYHFIIIDYFIIVINNKTKNIKISGTKSGITARNRIWIDNNQQVSHQSGIRHMF